MENATQKPESDTGSAEPVPGSSRFGMLLFLGMATIIILVAVAEWLLKLLR